MKAYRAALPGPLVEFPTTALDRVGVPAWNVTVFPSDGHPGFGGTGYGATDEEALTGTYGETTEEFRSWLALSSASRLRSSYVDLVRSHGAGGVQDPRSLALPAGADWTPERPLDWLPMRRLRDDAVVLVPAEFVGSNPHDLPDPPPGGWLTTPVTNGLGAGLDLDRAVAHGVLEILQRDGNGLTFRALDRGVVIDLSGLDDPVSVSVLASLRAAGVSPLVKLGSTDFGIPNVYAVGAAPDDGILAATACGEAAHPDRSRAVRKALLEFAAARPRKLLKHGPVSAVASIAPAGYLDRALAAVDLAHEEQRVLSAMVSWLRSPAAPRPALERTVFSRRSTVDFTALPSVPADEPAEVLSVVLPRLASEGHDVLVFDLSGDGVSAAKTIVTGLEVETVAYGRIGARGVRRARDLELDLVTSTPVPGGLRVHLTPEDEAELGPAWLDPAAVSRAVDGLLPLYREPGRHAAPTALARS